MDAQDAVLWRLETLAEATNRLTPELKARQPDIRWRAIYGFRNIAAHGYLDLHIDRVWEIVETHLPSLGVIFGPKDKCRDCHAPTKQSACDDCLAFLNEIRMTQFGVGAGAPNTAPGNQ